MGFGYGFFGLFETLFPIFFFLIVIIMIGMLVYTIVSGVSGWHRNNQSPVLTVEAAVVTKRGDVTHYHGSGDSMGHSSTRYYVTFEVASGDRMELPVSGEEYGVLVEGDRGTLTFQGTRYLGFERVRSEPVAH